MITILQHCDNVTGLDIYVTYLNPDNIKKESGGHLVPSEIWLVRIIEQDMDSIDKSHALTGITLIIHYLTRVMGGGNFFPWIGKWIS